MTKFWLVGHGMDRHGKWPAVVDHFTGGGMAASTRLWLAGIPAAGGGRGMIVESELFIEEPPRFLLSWYYREDFDEYFEQFRGRPLPPTFVDSGAFSAHSQGSGRLSVADYVAWLRDRPELATYATLDVIGDWRETARNTDRMIAAGMDPLPTWHVGSPLHELRRILREHRRVAIGGMVGRLKTDRLGTISALDGAWRVVGEESPDDGPLPVHGFGLTAWDLVLRWPWASVDSSSWLSVGLFGRAQLFDRRAGRFVNCTMSDRSDVLRNARLLQEHGLSVPRVLRSSMYAWAWVGTAWAYRLAERWLEQRHDRRTRLWLAERNVVDFRREVALHYESMQGRTTP